MANGTQQLYIGGRFASACGAASANVAVLVEGYWLPLAEGVAGSSQPPCTLNPAPYTQNPTPCVDLEAETQTPKSESLKRTLHPTP